MKKRKICVILTTRGNYAKMKGVMNEINRSDDLELQLILAGGAILDRYGLAGESLVRDRYHVDRVIHFVVEGENLVAMAKSAGLGVIEFSSAFENLKPDVVIVIADRFECLAIAMAAVYMNIPIAHVEGGEISGSVDESVRHSISKLSHLHFPANQEAADRLIRMGEDPARVFSVGCTSLDVLAENNLNNLQPVIDLQGKSGVGPVIDLHKEYLLVIQHPVTTEYDDNLKHITQTIEAIRELKMNTIWIWPNIDAGSDSVSKGIRVFREKYQPDYVHFFKSLPIEYYAPLLNNAACLVGNSSSGIRESAFLGVPTVNIGTRQSGRQRGRNVVDVDYDKDEIVAAIKRQLAHGHYKPDLLYGDGKSCSKIVDILKKIEFKIQKQISY